MFKGLLKFLPFDVGCGCIILILVLNLLIGGVTTQYVLAHWLPLFVHHPVNPPLFPCVVAGLFVAEFSLPVSIITWLLVYIGVLA